MSTHNINICREIRKKYYVDTRCYLELLSRAMNIKAFNKVSKIHFSHIISKLSVIPNN